MCECIVYLWVGGACMSTTHTIFPLLPSTFPRYDTSSAVCFWGYNLHLFIIYLIHLFTYLRFYDLYFRTMLMVDTMDYLHAVHVFGCTRSYKVLLR